MTVLEAKHISKIYSGRNYVLNDFNFKLESGRIVGLLGPNGCGKTTFLKLVSGLLTPTAGSIEVCGIPVSERTNSLVSYLPERTYFNPSMRVSELMDYFCDFYPDFDRAKAEKMLGDLQITTNRPLKALSKGQREKVQLVLVMARRARLYLLDEPIGGVDPASRDYILQTIVGNYAEDATVVITTHLIYDIEPVLDEFMFLGYGGQIIMGGNADDIRAQYGRSLDQLFREVFRCANY
ncbi:MAG: ABC transporter ATP-binding protein [Firmicutes bacterium]|nr:ABC transporter ATP-binding protein [Bacillota bacterium]